MYHRAMIPTRLSLTDEYDQKSAEDAMASPTRENERHTQQRDATVLHALFAYLSTLVHLPVLIWSVSGMLHFTAAWVKPSTEVICNPIIGHLRRSRVGVHIRAILVGRHPVGKYRSTISKPRSRGSRSL